MILATVLTVVLSVSFRSITEIQVTKLEEESQKALAAAEAALEAALRAADGSATIGTGSLSDITGFSGSANLDTTTKNDFTSTTINKDGAYTFYLGSYDLATHKIGASLTESIDICFKSASTNPALEITLIKTSGLKKYVVDPDSRITNASSPSLLCSRDNSYNYSYTIPGADIGADGQLLIIKSLYQGGKLYFSRSSNLPLQGKTINSEAASTTGGVSKKITLFQSYPQIPSEFFNTTF